MKTEEEIRLELQRLYTLFMNPSTKKPIHDRAFIEYHKLVWVLENEEDVIEKRLKEIDDRRN